MAALTYAEDVGPLGELGALFNPGMRHEIEERKSKANRREEEGNARDGDVRIDLASGVAIINIPGRTRTEGEPTTSDESTVTDPDSLPAAEVAESPGPEQISDQQIQPIRSVDPVPARSTSTPPTAAPSTAGRTSSQNRRAAARTTRSSGSADRKKAGADQDKTPRTGPVPSSKASRAAR